MNINDICIKYKDGTEINHGLIPQTITFKEILGFFARKDNPAVSLYQLERRKDFIEDMTSLEKNLIFDRDSLNSSTIEELLVDEYKP